MTLRPIDTPVGFLYGRDCIHADAFLQKHQYVRIEGEISGDLLRPKRPLLWIAFTLGFSGVRAATIAELEFASWQPKSSFDEVIGSDWIQELRSQSGASINHYVVSDYDFIYQIAAEAYQFTVGDARNG